MSAEGTDATTTDAGGEGQAADTAGQNLTDEVEKWKALARKHEQRAKENATAATELEKLREASATDQEKAIAAARREAAAEAAKGFGSKLAEAQFRVAAAGVLDSDQLDGLLEVVDLGKFVDDNGDPNIDAINAAVSRVAPKSRESDGPPPDDHQGAGSREHMALNGDPLTNSLKAALGIP